MSVTGQSGSDRAGTERFLVLDVTGLAQGGDGVAREAEGRVVFVAGALPGERVRARLVEERRRYARAEVVEVLEAAPERRPVDCPHELEDGCGGCGFRHLVDGAALALKARAALGELRKLAPALAWPEPVCHPERSPDGARHRVRYHLRSGRLGLFRRGSHELVSVPGCRVAHPDIVRAAGALEAALVAAGSGASAGTVLVERAQDGCFASLRAELDDGARRAVHGLVERGALRGACLLGKGRAESFGADWILERTDIGGRALTFHRQVGTFAQANPRANGAIREALYRHLSARRPSRVLDLFAGSGNLSLVAALTAPEVVALERDERALAGLELSARANALHHVAARPADLARGLGLGPGVGSFDTVVLDPPRTGASTALIAEILALGPEVIAYLACSPPHLARDAAALGEGWEVAAVEAFDMFPRTPHLELLAVLQRRAP